MSNEIEDVDMLELLKSGNVSISEMVDTADCSITITISDDDTDEVRDIKDNIEFTVSSAREGIAVMTHLLKQSGNPRFADGISNLLHAINTTNNQLLKIHSDKTKPKTTDKKKQNEIPSNVTNIQMISSDKVIKNPEKTIDLDEYR